MKNVLYDYKDTVYPEENSHEFRAIEKCAVSSQKIWLKNYSNILHCKQMERLLDCANKFNIDQLPSFVWKIFFLYCKIKSLKRK